MPPKDYELIERVVSIGDCKVDRIETFCIETDLIFFDEYIMFIEEKIGRKLDKEELELIEEYFEQYTS